MVAHHLDGTLQIGLVGNEALAEVIGLARGLQNLGLEERQGGVVPAGTAAVLVLHAGDRVLLDGCKDRLVRLRRVFLFCLCAHCQYGEKGK